MKRILITMVILIALPFGLSMAQDSSKVTIFAGPEYDSNSGGDDYRIVAGVSIKAILGLSGIARVTIGEYGSLEADAVYFFDLSPKLSFGLMAGPSVDWTTVGENVTPTTYLVGASGAVLSWKPSIIGFSLAAKYKFTVVDGTAYQDGWNGGLYMTYSL